MDETMLRQVRAHLKAGDLVLQTAHANLPITLSPRAMLQTKRLECFIRSLGDYTP